MNFPTRLSDLLEILGQIVIVTTEPASLQDISPGHRHFVTRKHLGPEFRVVDLFGFCKGPFKVPLPCRVLRPAAARLVWKVLSKSSRHRELPSIQSLVWRGFEPMFSLQAVIRCFYLVKRKMFLEAVAFKGLTLWPNSFMGVCDLMALWGRNETGDKSFGTRFCPIQDLSYQFWPHVDVSSLDLPSRT